MVPVWTPKPVLTPGDVPPARKEGHKVSPLEVRELSELIRTRYMLDIKIWNKRYCHTEDRPLIEGFMRRADAALLRIRSTVEAWDNAEAWKFPADWRRLKDIRAKLDADGKRMWAEHPPWEDQPQGISPVYIYDASSPFLSEFYYWTKMDNKIVQKASA